MSLLAFLFRLILFLFAIRLAGMVLRVFLRGFLKGSRPVDPNASERSPTDWLKRKGPGQIEELVRDPVCGVHIARSTAIAGRHEGAPAYFCSEECAAKAS